MRNEAFQIFVFALALSVAVTGCAGNTKNYRDGTGTVQGETRALDGVTK